MASISSRHPVPVSRWAKSLAPRGGCLARDRGVQAARTTLNLGIGIDFGRPDNTAPSWSRGLSSQTKKNAKEAIKMSTASATKLVLSKSKLVMAIRAIARPARRGLVT